jgi:hypothetical protein
MIRPALQETRPYDEIVRRENETLYWPFSDHLG